VSAARERWASRWRFVSLAGVLFVAVGGLLYFTFGRRSASLDLAPPERTAVASYVGAKACAHCHDAEYQEWRKSDHAVAMQHAAPETMLGNFANAKYSYAGITSTFFNRGGKFFVNTEGPDGKLQDFEIKYTFGVRPLQQYLIEFADGRIQPLSIAWDSRPKKDGGQRWFHLYPAERITHGDELHWSGPAQNWNFMCADCHSTDLRKNYSVTTNRFDTRWAEINVGCEACHGPGSEHLSWARARQAGKILNDPTKGLTARLDERRGVVWNPLPASGNAARSRPRGSEREIDVCAQCHARRGQFAGDYAAGKPFLDYYRPAFLTAPLYYADGQQRDEVYTWGSFLQSKMYAKGVTCSDCHNPHSGKLRAEGNQVCATCHQPVKYDAPTHHHHRAGSAGASCAACHMPTKTYMVVDPRHDHSLRIPRPDLSERLSTPNPCDGCHRDRDARWASRQVQQWYGHTAQGYQHFAGAFAAASAGALDAEKQLLAIATDAGQPAIARGTALAQLTGPLSRGAVDILSMALRDENPLVRLGALQALASAPPDSRVRFAAPLLADPLKVIRIEAASLLAPVPPGQFTPEQRAAFEHAGAEYVAAQSYNADRAEARVNLGTFYANRGDAPKAEEEMKGAIRLDRSYVPAYVNLADLYRALGRDVDGEETLREGLKVAPKSAMLHHALGLALVRLKRADAGLAELERAAVVEPANARYAYVYAVGLHSAGKVSAAIATLEKALAVHPNDRDILQALESFHAARGESTEAKKYADRLRALDKSAARRE